MHREINSIPMPLNMTVNFDGLSVVDMIIATRNFDSNELSALIPQGLI